jgi:hypothetical protein
MVKKRDEQEPWMPAPDYGRSLRGLSINLLVKDVDHNSPFTAILR